MICRADEHYTVVRAHGRVSRLICAKCSFTVNRDSVSGDNALGWTGGKSGTPRYNRMRGAMVRHIHTKHVDG
jgi:RNA processing factor Prp31